MKIPGFENKEFVFLIEYRADCDDLISEGMEDILETLRGTGEADIVDVKLIDKEVK